MQHKDIADAIANISSLLEAAMRGEEVVILKDNHPVVKLMPISPEQKRWPAKAGSAIGLVTLSADFEEPIADFDSYEAALSSQFTEGREIAESNFSDYLPNLEAYEERLARGEIQW